MRLFGSVFIGLVIVLSGSLDGHAVSDSAFRSVLQRGWSGSSISPASFTRSGKVYLTQTMDFSRFNETRFTGTASTTMVLDKVRYRMDLTFSGSFSSASKTVTYRAGRITRSDRLPYGLKWCKGWGTLTLYRNKTRAGRFILKGNVSDSCGNRTMVELVSR